MNASVTKLASVRPKEFHFPVVADWAGGRRVCAQVEGKAPLEVAPPVVFSGTNASAWSPEDFFVAAAASCLAVTFTGIAERAGLEFDSLRVAADGICGMRPDGRFGFTGLTFRFELDTRADRERAVELAERAEESCLVAASLDVPIETQIVVHGG